MNKIHLLIADDHPLVREGLRALMLSTPDIEIIGEAADGQQAVELARQLTPEVILMDLMMPRKDGLEAIREILSERPSTHILVITSFSEDERVFQAIQSGALGYLLKDTSSDELIRAIRVVAQGEAHLPPVIARKLIRKINLRPQASAPVEALTRRESSVLALAAKGLPNKEISSVLGLSVRTVDAHMRSLFKKLNISNRTQLALVALRNGLIDSPYPPPV